MARIAGGCLMEVVWWRLFGGGNSVANDAS
jgi:hypothetical protein